MMWFKMCDQVLDCAPAYEIAQCRPSDHYGFGRLMLFIKILLYALYPSKCFVDARALSIVSGVSMKQTQIVWDVCIKHGVLRKEGYGYNARAWLKENHFLGRDAPQEVDSEADKAFIEGVHGKAAGEAARDMDRREKAVFERW